ncbi:diguanylate cyclase (GGDEF)-like protein [Inhella inkyongensis]|uniref:Diguanylate cyclase (GGDEF)-like protein n=1 Tax=Inhella inkyongensis TaxID=392593 RepID=A0A840S2X3_9BURK|nr:EAL domain-containing protein [Inhella inkyongensis]MBB5203031.1 diguanylate cyclase (GGDEF)-like protein [Inhella inkyongensis]
MRRPAYLNVQRLEGRIVALFLGLLLLVQLGGFGLVQRAIHANAVASIDKNLKDTEWRLQFLLAQRMQRLHDKAVLLAADSGLRQAIGLMHDEAGAETLRDALQNHAQRIGASLAVFTDPNQQVVAAVGPQAERLRELARELQGAPPQELAAQLTLIDGRAYQLAKVAVNTPAPAGELVLGFALDAEVLINLEQLTNVESLLMVPDAAAWRLALAVIDAGEAQTLIDAAAQGRVGSAKAINLTWHEETWRARLMTLPALGTPTKAGLHALLRASVDTAVKPYKELQGNLLILTLAGVAAFALGAVLTARRIGGPIKGLARSAERLGQGDYDSPVAQPEAVQEVRDLATALESMRGGIKTREAEVHRLAYWDPLTGLPNRAQFMQQLRERLRERLQQPGGALAVLMLDLDRFKHVNDVLGPAVGDQLLQRVGERLRALAPEPHLLARLGGDEFALMVEGAKAQDALQLAQQISRSFEAPLCIGEQTIDVGAGIGVALYPEHAQEAEGLMSQAEAAMYGAKRAQLGVALYDPAQDDRSQASLGLLSELRRAVEHNELRLYLQPKLDLHTRSVQSAEALVRWQHPTRGLVPPGLFIPFAEQTGFVRQLSAWVLRESARFASAAAAAGQPLRISVNLSTRDLLDADLPDKIRQLLDEAQADPSQLCLEITESAIMDDPERALRTTEQLHAMGFKLAIDDFGTGYSSLAYLKRLPVQELKIDQSFVMAMETEADDRKIVRSTIDLAHNLGLSVVAEGIETLPALRLLAQWGCDEAQGYYMAKPMPCDQFLAWQRQWSAPSWDDGADPLTR